MSNTNNRLTSVIAAESMAENARTIAHVTGGAMTGPELYEFLGELKMMPGRVSQALIQVSYGLELSLKHYDVYQDDGGDPADVVTETVGLLAEAAELAKKLGTALEAAQAKIALQGNRGRISNAVNQ